MGDPETAAGTAALAPQAGDGWELFTHDADIGVRGLGATRADAFARAALAMTAAITDPAGVAARERVEITCTAPSDDLLFFEWLNAVVYEMATRSMLFAGFDVAIEDHRLRATLAGEPVDVARHQPAVEVKGATLTELRVARKADGSWLAQCVIDV